MQIVRVHPSSPIPLQAALAPAKALHALFFRAIGTILSSGSGKKLLFRALQIENRQTSLLYGFWFYGRKFLVVCDNRARSMGESLEAYQAKGYCRGNCFWLIDLHLRYPHIPLEELARRFEKGTPPEAVFIHEHGGVPVSMREDVLEKRRIGSWREGLSPKQLPPGVYSLMIGFSEGVPVNGHRIALFKGEKTLVFDPMLGLSEWKESVWESHLRWIGKQIQTSNRGFFTLEWVRH